MKNLRKLLAVVVVVAMMLTTVYTAFAAVPTDVKGTNYESAVTRLMALGVLTGRPDGTFAPDQTITRSEFAAVVVRALGYGTAAEAAKAQTKFSDVAADNWASGYINLAFSLGIINGRPDGTFGANDPVLYEEAVTMIVRALGYEPAAKANGGYPTGYLTIASQEDIDDGAVLAVGVKAPRGIVAKLVDNSLEVPLMVQVGYGTETKFVKSGTEDTDEQTLLADKLKLDKYEDATVVSVDTDKNEIKVDTEDGKKTYEAFETVSILGLDNCIIDLWVKDGTVYNIKNNTTVMYDYIDEIGGEDDAAAQSFADEKDVKLLNADDTFDIAEDADGDITTSTLYIELNGTEEDIADDNDSDNFIGAFAKVYLDGDDKIFRIEAYDLTEGGIITALEDTYVNFTKGGTENKKVRGIDDPDSMLVVVDGKVAALSDLKADMVMDYYQDGADYVLVASTGKAEGELADINFEDDSSLDIGDETFDVEGDFDTYFSTDNGDGYDPVAVDGDLDDLIGLSVVGYLNNKGEVRYIKGEAEDSTSDFYGYVEKAYTTDNDYLKVFRDVDGEGKAVTYPLDLDDDSAVTFDDIDATTEGTLNGVYKFTINTDGEITSIEDPTTANLAAGNVDSFDEDADAIVDGGDVKHYVGDATMFDLTDLTDPALVLWSEIKEKEPSAQTALTYETSKASEFVAFTAGFDDVASEDQFVAYVSKRVKADSDNYTLTLETADETLTKLIDKDDDQLPESNELFVVYVEDGENAIDAKAFYEWNTPDANQDADASTVWSAVDADVYDIDDGFIQLNENGAWVKIASDVVVYEVDDDASDFTKADLTDIAVEKDEGLTNGDSVELYTDDGVVKAIFFRREENE